MKVVNIKTEYLRNPVGLGIASPRINWTLEGCNKQSSYEIVYSVNGVEKTTGVISSNAMHHDFEESFSSRDHVDFVVKVTSDENEVASSEPCFFEIGLLSSSDWDCSWISGDYSPKKNVRYPVDCFRKRFPASKVKKARLYISALGLYEAHLNGSRVGTFVLAPGSTDYRKRIQYQAYDVTSLLKEGGNELTIELADGWYRGSIGAKGFTCVFGKATAVKAQLEITDENGNVSIVPTDASFEWSNDGAIRFADLKDGEVVDLSKKPSYKGRAKVIKNEIPLTASNNTFIEEHEVFEPVSTTKKDINTTVYEFRQNLAGYISLKFVANEGDRIDIVMGEMLDESGDVTLKNVQCVRKGKRTPLQEVHIIAKQGLNEYKGKFFIAGFRYVEVKGSVSVDSIKQIALYSSFEETSSFESSNPLINTFVRNTLWSLKSNSADVPTDCPTRERMGWTGDSQVFFNSASFLTDYAAFARKHMVDVFDRQDKNGRLPQIAPYNAEDWFMDVMNGSVGWADVGVLIPYRFYKRYGDDRILREHYDDIMRYARFMIKRCGPARGIYSIYAKPLHLSKENRRYGVNTGQSYGEWAEPNDVKAFQWYDFATPHPEESMAYTSYILGLVAEIATMFGHDEDASLCRQYSEGVKKAYQELVTKPRFTIDTNRQAKLVRPLYMNLLTKEQEEFAKTRLIKALEFYGYRLGTGFLSTPFILDVLSDYDVEAAYRLLENEEMPGWLFMAKNDTGTIWEGWEGPKAQLGISSLNHYSKGALVEWLYHGMCGIEVVGDNLFRIAPVIGGKETHASLSYRSIYGLISSSWKKTEKGVEFDIDVPSNTLASFIYKGENKTLEPGHHHFVCE